jgi:hypothetical protein
MNPWCAAERRTGVPRNGNRVRALSGQEGVRRRLETAAQQAAFLADLALARTAQAQGDRVGAAGYVERYVNVVAG